MRLLLAVLALAGCAGAYRPATGTGKPTATVTLLVHVALDGQRVIRRRMVTLDNPTGADTILDCHSARFRVPAHMATDVLLMPGDTGCDYQGDTIYESIPIFDVPIGVTVKGEAK